MKRWLGARWFAAFWLAAFWLAPSAPGITSAHAQDDDWSITREESPRVRGRGGRRTRLEPRAAPDLRERYLSIVLADPRDGFAMDRLLGLYREGSSLASLETALEARRATAPAEGAAIDVVRARIARENGETERARELYLGVLSSVPSHWLAELGLSALDRARGELSAARGHLERAIAGAAAADREELLRELGELCLDLGDFDGAEHAYAELGRGARSVHLRTELMRALAARGEHERALTGYRALATELSGDRRVLAPLLVEVAREELALGRIDAAIETLADARRRAAGSAGVRGEIVELTLDAHRRAGTLDALVTAWESARGTEERLARARALDELGRDDEAVAAYRRAIAARPRDVEARMGEIQVLLRTGRIDDAIRSYQALLRVAGRPAHVLALAELLEAHGRRAEAIEIAERLLRTAGAADVATLDALAGLFARWHDEARATRALARRAELSPSDPVPLVALGDQLLQAGDEAGARRAFERILTLGGDADVLHATLGAVYLDHDRLPDAIAELETALRLGRERGRAPDPETLRLLASAHERAGQSERAEAAWRDVLAASADDPARAREAREHIAQSWARGRTLDRHITELRAAFDAEPPDLEAGRFLVEAQRRRSDVAGAITTLRRLDRLAPGDLSALELLERLEVQRGDLAGAIDALERLARAEPRRAAERYRRMVEHALALYRDDDARRYARRAVELAPDDARGWARLAELERTSGDLTAAAHSLGRAVELDPTAYELTVSLAELEITRGERAHAETLLLDVVRGSPDDAQVAEAVRAMLDLHATDEVLGTGLLPLESALLSQVLRAPGRVALRRAYVELMAARVTPLAARVDADPDARAELGRVVTRGLAPLLLAIGSEDPVESGRAMELVRLANVPGAASTLLGRAERAGDAAARLEALATLAPLAAPAHAARLGALASGGDAAVRVLATWALGRALAGSPAALERALFPLLTDPEREVRAIAALALWGQSEAPVTSVAARARMTAMLEAGGAELPIVSWACARTLPEVIAARFTTLGAATAPLLYFALGRTEAPAAQRFLAFAMLDPEIRETATGALRARLALPADQNPRPGETAVAFLFRTLGTRALDLSDLAAPLEAMLTSALAESAGDELARSALSLLTPTRIAGRPGVALEGLSVPIDDERARLPDRVLRAIEPALSRSSRSTSVALRARATALLAASLRASDPTLFEAALADPSPIVLRAALEARAGAPVDEALEPVLIAALSHRDWSIRAEAAGALAGTSSARTEAALVELAATDPYALVRDAAVRALGARPRSADADAALFSICGGDVEARVRASAAALIHCD